MGIGETDFTQANFEIAGSFSPVNTVYVASSPVVKPIQIDFTKIDSSLGNIDTFKKVPPKKQENVSKKKTTVNKSPQKNQITKMVNFMGKKVEMTGHIKKNPDGTSTEFLINKDGGTCTIIYDKDGKVLSITQELYCNDKVKTLSTKFDPETEQTTTTSINRDADNHSNNEFTEIRDKDNNIIERREIIKDGSKLTISTNRVVDQQQGIIRAEDESMDLTTGDQTRIAQDIKTNENGEEVIIMEEKTETKKGVTTSNRSLYDDNGNQTFSSSDTAYPDGRRQTERAVLNHDNTITETTSNANDRTGKVDQYTVQKDENGNIISESTFVKENGITTQEHQSYKNNQVVSHSVMETGAGVMNDTQSRLNEDGQWETTRTMMLQGKKYTDETEFKKALEEHLKQR